jgi:hypothetical protein
MLISLGTGPVDCEQGPDVVPLQPQLVSDAAAQAHASWTRAGWKIPAGAHELAMNCT